ncbi:MAG TPA: NADP-dependent malic enzyme [Candidatus Limnocylindria bacterium]|nr:NADP-dependent malic enzyme [Candidatus Limnocylindria bacterium]
MLDDTTREELLAKAEQPAREAIRLHQFYAGKIEVWPKAAVRDVDDFAYWYTPGVAEPCLAIAADRELSYELTGRGNTIAIVSDGSRVLGLGNIGPEGAMPVMEGKALIYKLLGGVDAVPICLGTQDIGRLIRAVKQLEPSFGGINLEDIEHPKCFELLDKLREIMRIPVWHDDQQGTAAVTLAGLINALRVVGKPLASARVAVLGAGAASIACARFIIAAGVDPDNVVLTDSTGILNKRRRDLRDKSRVAWELALLTNGEGRAGGIADAMRGMDAVIAYTTPGPGIIDPAWIAGMAADPIVFACANPTPEIWPWEAREAGAAVVATGRSDLENQINNSLAFPGIFRGALDVRATSITDEMAIAGAYELADYAADPARGGLRADHLLPTMDEREVVPHVAAAVGAKAVEQGIARRPLTRDELMQLARAHVERAGRGTAELMRTGLIAPMPDAPHPEMGAIDE